MLLNRKDPDWLLMVTFGLMTHVENVCISGLCKTQTFPNPNAASIFFCLSLCIIIAQINWWPVSLKRPHRIFISLYKMILTGFIVDVIMRSVYISYLDALKQFIDMLMEELSKLQIKELDPYIAHMKDPETMLIISTLISIGVVVLAIYMTCRNKDLSQLANTIICKVKTFLQIKS